MTRTPPRKPSEPLATIVFRGGGRGVHMVAEPLPRVKDDLELAIVTKFLGAMRTEAPAIGPPTRGDEWPDFEASLAERRVGIEIVEMINPDHAQKRARQLQYLEALLPLVQDLASVLDQMAMTIVDGYQDPPWPPAGSQTGQRLVRHLATKIHAEADTLTRIAPQKSFYRQWDDFEGSSVHVGMMAMRGRRLPGDLTTGLDLRFAGTFPSDLATENEILASTIETKVRKKYAGYSGGQLWLLAYTHNPSTIGEAAVTRARAKLDWRAPPFDAVWAFFPFPAEDSGIVAKVLP